MAIALIPLDVQAAQAAASGDPALLAGVSNAQAVAESVREAAGMQAALYERVGAEAPWIGYLARDDDSGAVVGICSFMDRLRDGVVEIAYYTFDGHEGKGWGGDMATALVDLALGEDGVEVIVAHTEPAEGPATKILARLGFAHSGTFEDADNGAVWQWTLEKSGEEEDQEA